MSEKSLSGVSRVSSQTNNPDSSSQQPPPYSLRRISDQYNPPSEKINEFTSHLQSSINNVTLGGRSINSYPSRINLHRNYGNDIAIDNRTDNYLDSTNMIPCASIPTGFSVFQMGGYTSSQRSSAFGTERGRRTSYLSGTSFGPTNSPNSSMDGHPSTPQNEKGNISCRSKTVRLPKNPDGIVYALTTPKPPIKKRRRRHTQKTTEKNKAPKPVELQRPQNLEFPLGPQPGDLKPTSKKKNHHSRQTPLILKITGNIQVTNSNQYIQMAQGNHSPRSKLPSSNLERVDPPSSSPAPQLPSIQQFNFIEDKHESLQPAQENLNSSYRQSTHSPQALEDMFTRSPSPSPNIFSQTAQGNSYPITQQELLPLECPRELTAYSTLPVHNLQSFSQVAGMDLDQDAEQDLQVAQDISSIASPAPSNRSQGIGLDRTIPTDSISSSNSNFLEDYNLQSHLTQQQFQQQPNGCFLCTHSPHSQTPEVYDIFALNPDDIISWPLIQQAPASPESITWVADFRGVWPADETAAQLLAFELMENNAPLFPGIPAYGEILEGQELEAYGQPAAPENIVSKMYNWARSGEYYWLHNTREAEETVVDWLNAWKAQDLINDEAAEPLFNDSSKSRKAQGLIKDETAEPLFNDLLNTQGAQGLINDEAAGPLFSDPLNTWEAQGLISDEPSGLWLNDPLNTWEAQGLISDEPAGLWLNDPLNTWESQGFINDELAGLWFDDPLDPLNTWEAQDLINDEPAELFFNDLSNTSEAQGSANN